MSSRGSEPGTDLAYLAGVVDSDGWISIGSSTLRGGGRRWFARVGICGTRTAPHELAVAIFGGRLRSYVNRGSPRLMWEWTRSGAAAVPVLDAVRPFLRVKAEQADLAIEAQMVAAQQSTLGADFAAQLDGLAEAVRDLNQWRRGAWA